MAITNITEAIDALKDLIEVLPAAITVDNTLNIEGSAADAKATGNALAGKADSSHSQAASTITAGTFNGIVTAPRSSQTYSTYMLRNSRLASSNTNPSYNGEICWTYE